MLTDDILQRMYELAYCLHPDHGTALAVTLDACERIALLRRVQDRRAGHYKFRLPEACLPQYCVYLASEAREPEQERLLPGKEPRYRPSPDDRLVRHALAMFTPWGAPHVSGSAAERSILETYFDGAANCSDWDRIHALIDPACSGLPRLVREYNQYFPMASGARLADPDDKMVIPCFHS